MASTKFKLMCSIDFTLSFSNLLAIPLDKYEPKFTFIVNEKRYETSRIVADLLSPIIRQRHYNDPTSNEFFINTDVINNESNYENNKNQDYFLDFLNLTKFKEVNVDSIHHDHFSYYFLRLGNIDEYLKLCPEYFDEITIDNVVDRLKNINIEISGLDFVNNPEVYGNINKLITYAASNFADIDKEELKQLDNEIIEDIISNKSLQLEEEDELFDFLMSKYENDKTISNLFEYVDFTSLSEDEIEKFTNEFSFDNLSYIIWQSICQRLLASKKSKKKNKRYKNLIIKKKPAKDQEFDGIFNYLTQETGGNIHDNDTIKITSNSIHGDNHHPKNVVDYHSDNYYDSNGNIKNPKICFDLKDKRVQLTSYSIKSQNLKSGSYHLKNWIVEVSNDGNNWESVDEHSNDSTLNGPNILATFNTKQKKKFYRYIQIRQTGPGWYNSYSIEIPYFEIYGKLKKI